MTEMDGDVGAERQGQDRTAARSARRRRRGGRVARRLLLGALALLAILAALSAASAPGLAREMAAGERALRRGRAELLA
ncbi:MAG TPA: hypothetical protein VNP94_07255, partial [Actinomycetota bacterium]|nr:hypothetical protein [Actinomycetota bacterium]